MSRALLLADLVAWDAARHRSRAARLENMLYSIAKTATCTSESACCSLQPLGVFSLLQKLSKLWFACICAWIPGTKQ